MAVVPAAALGCVGRLQLALDIVAEIPDLGSHRCFADALFFCALDQSRDQGRDILRGDGRVVLPTAFDAR